MNEIRESRISLTAAIVNAMMASTQYDKLETAEEVAAHWDSLGVPKCPAPAFVPTNRAERRQQERMNRKRGAFVQIRTQGR